jgi:hypothetical protein
MEMYDHWYIEWWTIDIMIIENWKYILNSYEFSIIVMLFLFSISLENSFHYYIYRGNEN